MKVVEARHSTRPSTRPTTRPTTRPSTRPSTSPPNFTSASAEDVLSTAFGSRTELTVGATAGATSVGNEAGAVGVASGNYFLLKEVARLKKELAESHKRLTMNARESQETVSSPYFASLSPYSSSTRLLSVQAQEEETTLAAAVRRVYDSLRVAQTHNTQVVAHALGRSSSHSHSRLNHSNLLSISSLKKWSQVQELVACGALSEAVLDDALTTAGVRIRAADGVADGFTAGGSSDLRQSPEGFITFEQFVSVMGFIGELEAAYLEGAYNEDVDGDEDEDGDEDGDVALVIAVTREEVANGAHASVSSRIALPGVDQYGDEEEDEYEDEEEEEEYEEVEEEEVGEDEELGRALVADQTESIAPIAYEEMYWDGSQWVVPEAPEPQESRSFPVPLSQPKEKTTRKMKKKGFVFRAKVAKTRSEIENIRSAESVLPELRILNLTEPLSVSATVRSSHNNSNNSSTHITTSSIYKPTSNHTVDSVRLLRSTKSSTIWSEGESENDSLSSKLMIQTRAVQRLSDELENAKRAVAALKTDSIALRKYFLSA